MGGASAAQPPDPGPPPDVAPPHFASPSVDVHTSFLAALAEYHAEGHHLELPADRLADPEEFARYVAALRADVETPGAAARYVAALTGSAPEVWPDGYVPQSIFWWVAGAEYIGRLGLRHRLTPHLLVEGGNIGYEVRPSARGQGHATAMLAAALPLAAGLGIDLVHLDCDDDNPVSLRVIEKNGGRLERREAGCLYYVVSTR
jgi:predicted acetyltransferase